MAVSQDTVGRRPTDLFASERRSSGQFSSGTVGPVVDALAHVSSDRAEFSSAAVEEIMRQYNNVSSGEMRNLSTALLELLVRNQSLNHKIVDKRQSKQKGLKEGTHKITLTML